MYITIKNKNHPEIVYSVQDETPELNLPSIPSGYSLVFKNMYTNKIDVISDDQLVSLFSHNHLSYNITLFNEIYNIESGVFDQTVLNKLSKYSTYKLFQVVDNELSSTNDIMNFTNYPEDYYTKNEVNDELSNISESIETLENKISSLEEVSKKEEIENELNLLEAQISALIS